MLGFRVWLRQVVGSIRRLSKVLYWHVRQQKTGKRGSDVTIAPWPKLPRKVGGQGSKVAVFWQQRQVWPSTSTKQDGATAPAAWPSIFLNYIRGDEEAKKRGKPRSRPQQPWSQPAVLGSLFSLQHQPWWHCGTLYSPGWLSVGHVEAYTVERESDVVCRGNRNATADCHCGIVSHFSQLKTGRGVMQLQWTVSWKEKVTLDGWNVLTLRM